jgi:hypothetical protein
MIAALSSAYPETGISMESGPAKSTGRVFPNTVAEYGIAPRVINMQVGTPRLASFHGLHGPLSSAHSPK